MAWRTVWRLTLCMAASSISRGRSEPTGKLPLWMLSISLLATLR